MCNIGSFTGPKTVARGHAKAHWRWFRVSVYGNLLPLTNNGATGIWHPELVKANQTPHQLNSTGLYAFFTRQEAEKQRRNLNIDLILAKVVSWGVTARHKKGIRSHHARVTELHLDTIELSADKVKLLKKKYPHVKFKKSNQKKGK